MSLITKSVQVCTVTVLNSVEYSVDFVQYSAACVSLFLDFMMSKVFYSINYICGFVCGLIYFYSTLSTCQLLATVIAWSVLAAIVCGLFYLTLIFGL